MNYRRMFLLLTVLFIAINVTNGILNHSLLIKEIFNRTSTTNPSWKRSNSIETLKKLIANRQILTKYNRKLFFKSKFHFSI
jgi:hypothetical protein